MSNLAAAHQVVASMRDLGQIEAVDEALVTAVFGLARACDDNPEVAALWREYRLTLEALRERNHQEQDALSTLLGELSASLGDQEERPANARPAGGGDRRADGAAADAVAAPGGRRRPRGGT